MIEKSQFITMNINVDGQIHKVKVQKGVTFNFGAKENSWNSCWAENDEKAGIIKNRPNFTTNDYGERYYNGNFTSNVEYSPEIKMLKCEFAIFKNFADNIKENGDEIILSKDDINKAEKLYSNGEFTEDMSKNLPSGYKANRDDQILEHHDIYSYVGGSVTDTQNGEKSYVEFILDDNNYNVFSNIKKYAKESANGEVVTEVGGEGMSCWVEGVSFCR